MQVNHQPSFVVITPVQVEDWEPRQRRVFATNLTAGAGEDQEQGPNLRWDYRYTNPQIFIDPAPSIVVEFDASRNRIGVIYWSTTALAAGDVTFFITLIDGGPTNPAQGSFGESVEDTFVLSIRENNRAPFFRPNPLNIFIQENSDALVSYLHVTLYFEIGVRGAALGLRFSYSHVSHLRPKFSSGAQYFSGGSFVSKLRLWGTKLVVYVELLACHICRRIDLSHLKRQVLMNRTISFLVMSDFSCSGVASSHSVLSFSQAHVLQASMNASSKRAICFGHG